MYQCCVEVWVNAALHVHKGRVLCLWHESFAARGEVQFTERRRGEIREVVVTKSPPATRERNGVVRAFQRTRKPTTRRLPPQGHTPGLEDESIRHETHPTRVGRGLNNTSEVVEEERRKQVQAVVKQPHRARPLPRDRQ